mmetsp:Transcript_3266/g.4447  ORF Transcript_3266/g.4447 Transcript_3266/m.4447 type:complete len:169 (-) Transcript_3266:162-668(-)
MTRETEVEPDLDSVPGIVDHPLSWGEICDFISNKQYSKLGRMPAEIQVYREFRTILMERYKTVGDFILSSVFEFDCVETSDSKTLEAIWPSLTKYQLVWRENDFPYSLEDGIEHHVLWTTGELTEEIILKEATKNRPGYEFVHFINPPELRSVVDVEHAQIMSRKLQN